MPRYTVSHSKLVYGKGGNALIISMVEYDASAWTLQHLVQARQKQSKLGTLCTNMLTAMLACTGA